MRILHVVYSCVPGEFRGGVPKVVYDLARAQVGLGHEVTIYTTNINGAQPVAVPAGSETRSDGVLIHYFGADERRWFWSTGLRKALLASPPHQDVIHSHNTFLALNRYAAEAHGRWGVPLFYHVHGALDPLVVRRGWFKRLRKRAYIDLIERANLNAADGIFALTSSEADQIHTYGITTPISVTPNGIGPVRSDGPSTEVPPDPDGAANAFRERFEIRADQPVILYLGRIVPKKGVHLLLQAFGELHREHPAPVLVLAGARQAQPDYVRTLDGIVGDYDLREAVRWTGFLNESEKGGAWAAAALFSHVSESEGMAVSVLEAMAAGLPVIVSRECYMSDAATAGAVVEIDRDAGRLRSTIESLLADAPLRGRIGSAARDYVRRRHAWPQIARQIVQVYERALAQAPEPSTRNKP
jgi:glycosyltransferase involved in cell wall biosynthesis